LSYGEKSVAGLSLAQMLNARQKWGMAVIDENFEWVWSEVSKVSLAQLFQSVYQQICGTGVRA